MIAESHTPDRRSLLMGAAGLLGLAACGPVAAQSKTGYAPDGKFASSPFRKVSDGDWKQRLPGQSYSILRHEDTEIAGSGPFLNEKRKGIFICRGCDLPLFKSDWKYESGTGWPSFYEGIKENIGVKTDRLLGYERVEYHCAQCLGHQGHIFEDGPRPTGLRYCNNGYSLKFTPA